MASIPFALITGGSSGLGKALAILLAGGGSSVAIVARNEGRLAEAKAAIEAAKAGDGFVVAIQADVTDEKQVKDAFDGLVRDKGVPTHLFNCAGAANPGYVQDFSTADFEAAMRLDYFGTVIPTITLLPYFIARGSGQVVNVSSAGGFVGLIGYATYCPAKFAVMGFSEVLRHELKPKGIKVSVVCPPDMDTPGLATENKIKPEECKIISERGKLLKPEDVAKAVVDGVEKGRFYILPGESNYIFNMKRLFPGLVFSIMDGDLRKALKKLGK
nr:SDR family oxidoreductase [Candidatus Sigynarchaeum springense]